MKRKKDVLGKTDMLMASMEKDREITVENYKNLGNNIFTEITNIRSTTKLIYLVAAGLYLLFAYQFKDTDYIGKAYILWRLGDKKRDPDV